MFSWFKNSRRKRLLAEPFPPEWLEILSRNVAYYALLPPENQKRLRDVTRILVAEREFGGARDVVVTPEMKVTIAAQAALLLLGVEGYYFDKMHVILIYRDRFSHQVLPLEAGEAADDSELLGEARLHIGVRLSWEDVLFSGQNPRDGENLVLHEFAHHLDGLDGEMGGHPPQDSSAKDTRWKQVMEREYHRLVSDVEQHRPTLLDPYGAENEAEFFAVATESFYEEPVELREEHPELYEILQGFYHVDPVVWFKG